MLLRLVFVTLLAIAGTARAQVTIYNFDNHGLADVNQIVRFDKLGNKPAFGNYIFQVGNVFHGHDTDQNCGFRIGLATPFCGFYDMTSTDLSQDWQKGGLLFPIAGHFVTDCAGNGSGCFGPTRIFNASTKQWVMWLNCGGSCGNSSGYFVFTSSVPDGGFVEQPQPVNMASNMWNGDFTLFVDTGGTAYIVYEQVLGTPGGRHILIQQLDASYTDAASTSFTDTGAVGEEPWMFKRGSTYYIVHSGVCTLCSGSPSSYTSASSPTGVWSSDTQISPDACGGQSGAGGVFTIASNTYYMWSSQNANPAGASPNDAGGFYNIVGELLSFTGTAINPITCTPSFTLPLTPNPPGPNPVDQSDEFYNEPMGNFCDLSSSKWYMQTFTAGVTGTMPKITMPLAMGTAGCGGSCSGANAPLPISLYNLDGSNNPTGTALASTSVTNVGAPFQLTEYSLALGAPLVKGNRYGIVLGATNTLGCWGYAFSTNNPYPGGLLRTSTNSGSSWADVGTGNQDLKFSTYLPTPTGGAGASASRGRLLH